MGGSTNNRYRFVDYFKAISIILVILAHANFVNESIKPWIEGFTIPAFFAASGLLLKSGTRFTLPEVGGTLWKRFQSVIFPYFFWALVYASLTPKNVIKIIYGSHVMLKSAGSLTSLWFLTTLFLALLLYEAANLILKKHFRLPAKLALMACTFVVAAILPDFKYGYPWNLNVSFCALGFLVFGNICFPAVQAVRRKLSTLGRGKQICVYLLATCVTFAGTLLYRFNIPENSPAINVARAIYGNFLKFILVGAIGTLMVLALSLLLEAVLPENGGRRDPLSFIGQSTLCILVTHKPIDQILFGKLFSMVHVPAPVALTVTCVGTLVISCLLTLFINRYLPLLAGKVPKKTTAG